MSSRCTESRSGGSSCQKRRPGGGARGGRQGKPTSSIRTQQTPQTVEGQRKPRPPSQQVRDLTEHLVRCGAYEEYKRWREGYRCWREGAARGAAGEALRGDAATAEGPPTCCRSSWRDGYRNWRSGGLRGARGEMLQPPGRSRGVEATAAAALLPEHRDKPPDDASLPPIVYDVVAGADGEPVLLPSDGPPTAPIQVTDLPAEAVITIRVFRFLEDRSDERQLWERSLLNVNSGSLFWLPWQLGPNLHTIAGAKYGTWFTIHFVQVLAKHFKSAYHMCNEGYSSGAKTFGCTGVGPRAITGEAMPEGYFWYVSPAVGQEHLRSKGWQHLDRSGPFDGQALLRLWHERGSPLEARALQQVLARVQEEEAARRLQS